MGVVREPGLVTMGRRSLGEIEREVVAVGADCDRLRREIASWDESIAKAKAGLERLAEQSRELDTKRSTIIAMLEAHGAEAKPLTDAPEPVPPPVVHAAPKKKAAEGGVMALTDLAAKRIQFAYGGRDSNPACWQIISAYNLAFGGTDRKLCSEIGRLLPQEVGALFAKRRRSGIPITVEMIEKLGALFEWRRSPTSGRRTLKVVQPEAFRVAIDSGVATATFAGCTGVSTETIRRLRRLSLGAEPVVRTPVAPTPAPLPLCCVCGKVSDPALSVDRLHWCSPECADVSMERLTAPAEEAPPEVDEPGPKSRKSSIQVDWTLIDRRLSEGALPRRIAAEIGIGRSTLQRYIAQRRDEGNDPRRRWNAGDSMQAVIVDVLDLAPGSNFTAVEIANVISDSHSPPPFRGGKGTLKAVDSALSVLVLGGSILSQESTKSGRGGRGPTFKSLKRIGRGAIR